MGISIAPTFVNIVLALTWAIYGLIALSLIWSCRLIVETKSVERLLSSQKRDKKVERLLESNRQDRLGLLFVRVPILLLLGVLNGVVRFWLPRMEPSLARVILGTIVALMFGVLLFTLKIVQLIVYGALEGIFAIGSCAFSLSHMGEKFTSSALIGLVSSIYLMIRSFDNIKKGIDERSDVFRDILEQKAPKPSGEMSKSGKSAANS